MWDRFLVGDLPTYCRWWCLFPARYNEQKMPDNEHYVRCVQGTCCVLLGLPRANDSTLPQCLPDCVTVHSAPPNQKDTTCHTTPAQISPTPRGPTRVLGPQSRRPTARTTPIFLEQSGLTSPAQTAASETHPAGSNSRQSEAVAPHLGAAASLNCGTALNPVGV